MFHRLLVTCFSFFLSLVLSPPTHVPLLIPSTTSLLSSTIDLSNWMSLSPLQNLSLSRLTLPGSHDSGTYALTTELGPLDLNDSLIEAVIEEAKRIGLPVEKVLLPWSTMESLNVTEQLQRGARYVDIRMGWNGKEWRVHHTLLGPPIQDILCQIRDFVDVHQQELVVVELSHFEATLNNTIDDESLNLAINIIEKALEGVLVTNCSGIAQQSISSLVRNRQRVLLTIDHPRIWQLSNHILCFGDPGNSAFINGTLFNTYANTDSVEKMESFNTQIINQFDKIPISDLHLLWKLSYTLTPQVSTIEASILPGHPHSAIDLTSLALSHLDSFLTTSSLDRHQLCNLMLIDDFGSHAAAGFVTRLIQMQEAKLNVSQLLVED